MTVLNETFRRPDNPLASLVPFEWDQGYPSLDIGSSSTKMVGVRGLGGLSSPISVWTASAQTEESASFGDSVGKRDPFLSPFFIAPGQNVVAEVTTQPQRFHLEQLKLVGVIRQTSQPKALINGGAIRTIEPGRIVVEEYETDWSE